MADKNDITFEIVEHIGVIDEISNRDEKWTKALVDRYRARSAQEHSAPMRDDYIS